jgi:hypothetical protein
MFAIGFWLLLWYLMVIVLSVLRFTDSGYLFGIFKLLMLGSPTGMQKKRNNEKSAHIKYDVI